ncbi:MAG: hypothetical protein HC769_02760 [Cyanobacteria bacterium CRU_2_1]|nr:hypothetical protein [Cyanobacteria bacterium RU_5_0]NJR57865.1 hypothetical protein [Cyanobacteria bacterium CRU_2_1]
MNGNNIRGSNRNDFIQGNDRDEKLLAGRGNDVLVGGAGNDQAYGDEGNDFFLGTDGGNDQSFGGEGNDFFRLGDGNDTVYGDSGNDIILASGGNDLIDGGSGFNLVFGGEGSDRFVLQSGGIIDIQDFQLGQDRLVLADGLTFDQLKIVPALFGTSSTIQIAATGEPIATLLLIPPDQLNEIHFVSFNDAIRGGDRSTRFAISAPSNTPVNLIQNMMNNQSSALEISVFSEPAIPLAETGARSGVFIFKLSQPAPTGGVVINFQAGDTDPETTSRDVNIGTAGTTNIDNFNIRPIPGFISTVTIAEGATEARLVVTPFEDGLVEGDETISIELLSRADYHVSLANNIATLTIIDDVAISGTDNNDVLDGTHTADVIEGLAGDDVINGNGGNDIIDSGFDEDIVNGGNGDDQIAGGGFLNGDRGNDSIQAGDGNNVINGGDGRDTIVGGSGADFINGDGGSDWVQGGEGTELILGGNGDDVLLGETGMDVLLGGNGDDVLSGGADANELTGGAGRDRFLIGPNNGITSITDFQNRRDRLVLEQGLTVDLLQIAQVGNDTFVSLAGQQQPFAILIGVQARSITETDFVVTLPPPTFSNLVVFGDSLSDTGNFFSATGGIFPPSPPSFNGRLSNGPLWVDFIAPKLGLTRDEVSNFAFLGALSGRENLSDALIPIANFPGLLDQIDTFAATTGANGADPDALYVVWAGSNDFLNLSDPQAVPTAIADAVTNLATSIATLANLGAEKIIVPNASDLGTLPFSIESGTTTQATLVSSAFNQALDQTLDQLEQTLGIDVISVDAFGFSQRIANAPEEFGFTNNTDPLIGQSGSVNPDEFVFFDEAHPTTRVHELFVDVVLTALKDAGYSVHQDWDYSLGSLNISHTQSTAPFTDEKTLAWIIDDLRPNLQIL